jgi:hypothetical protein
LERGDDKHRVTYKHRDIRNTLQNYQPLIIGEVKRQKVAKQRQQRLRLCMHSHCMPKYSDSDSVRTIRDNYKRFFASGRNFGLDIELSIQIQWKLTPWQPKAKKTLFSCHVWALREHLTFSRYWNVVARRISVKP